MAVGAVRVTVNRPSVQVTRGGTAMLPCSFQTSAALTRLNIIWTVSPLHAPKHPVQVIAYEQGQVVESLSEYLGRARFAFSPTRDASIFINHTRVTDTGTYQCVVLNPPDGATPNIGLLGLTVLVPPSIPECTSEGSGQEGGRIHLRCSVAEGVPAPRFRWEKISPDGQQLITSQEDYRGSSTLTNITSETSGLYRCVATNLLGSSACTMEIHVHVGGMSALGIFASVTVTLIMGLVLLALCGLVLCLHQQSQGKWYKAEPSPATSLSAGQPPANRRCCAAAWSRTARPLWIPNNPAEHNAYSIQHVLQTQGVKHVRPPGSRDSMSESEDDDDDEEESRPAPSPALHSSLYSLNSGFLV
ncbi:immunoglobulin superfamily member 11-like [Gastrophryne carolinensis]